MVDSPFHGRGDPAAWLLVVGDTAEERASQTLYRTLAKFNLAEGGIEDVTLTGAFVADEAEALPDLSSLPELKVIVTLGPVAHQAVVTALGGRLTDYRFGHNARHNLGGVTILSSHHCSRQNMNTGKLTPKMFESVFAAAQAIRRSA